MFSALLNFIVTLLFAIVLIFLLIHASVATFSPVTYGKFLQKIDNSRYEYIDRD